MAADTTPPRSTRAPRFPLRIPVRYRPAGSDAAWRDGRSENISRSGVLFRADDSPDSESAIEMMLTLGSELGADVAGVVICRGRVVRIEPGPPGDPRPTVAATIAGYRLVHSQGADPRRI
jgi:hypothetical protein